MIEIAHDNNIIENINDKCLNDTINNIIYKDQIIDLNYVPNALPFVPQVSDPNNVRITITNDGATILKSVPVENPAAKVLVDIAKIQDDTVGDGTTR